MGRRKGAPGLSLADASGPTNNGTGGRRKPPGLSLSGMNGGQGAGAGAPGQSGTPFSNFNKIVYVHTRIALYWVHLIGPLQRSIWSSQLWR